MGYKDRKRERPTAQEHEVAKDIGGKRVPASGAMPHAKGDAYNDRDLVDAKTTNKTLSLRMVDVMKHVQQSKRRGRIPVFQIELTDAPPGLRKWAVLGWEEYLARSGYED